MMLDEQRGGSARTGWFTAAFWMTMAFGAYVALGIPRWWECVLFTVVGVTASYGWWKRRQRGKLWLLFGVMCALMAALALFSGARAVLMTESVPADSVGEREVVCGSVVNPRPSDQLQVTDVETGEPVTESRPIPHSELDRVCGDRLRYRTGDATVSTLVGLLFAARAVGHVLPRRIATPALSQHTT